MKKVAISLVMLGMILGFSVPAILAGEGKIGGNLKLYLWDQSGEQVMVMCGMTGGRRE